MRRIVWMAPLVTAAALTAYFLLFPSSSPAQVDHEEVVPAPLAAKVSSPELPISQVTLYSSGVGYFQRTAQIEGNARIDLSFPMQDVNDLLKSMVLQDLGGGHISAVSYDSHDPIDKTLNSFAVNLTSNPSFGQVLNQCRGEKVEVLLKNGTAHVTGTVMGVDGNLPDAPNRCNVPPAVARGYSAASYKAKRPVDGSLPVIVDSKELEDNEVLNLWCVDGMRPLRLKDIQRIRFLNAKMESEIQRALEVLASSHDAQKKAVSLNFTGDGKRSVRVGYVVENPLWRTSYRLLVGKDGKLFLQGWALVENPSNEDWKDVRMALVSGRPISFQMELYQPLYLKRPVVTPEMYAGLQPQTHNGPICPSPYAPACLPPSNGPGAGAYPASAYPNPPPPPGMPQLPQLGAAQPANVPQGPQAAQVPAQEVADQRLQQNELNLRRGVVTAATGTDLGDFFQYVIEKPVTVPRQKSAMLPIVNKPLDGTKISLYNGSTHPKYPLLALHVKNTTGLHLMQGPITVFDGSSYAGDASLLDLPPKETRLISYALDTGTEVEAATKQTPEHPVAVKLARGVLTTTTRTRETCTYHVKNRSPHERLVWIEHPYRADYKLVSKDQPRERARDVYRFEIKVPAGQTVSHKVIEEHDTVVESRCLQMDSETIRYVLRCNVSDAKVKNALQEALTMQQKLAKTQQELNQEQQQLNTITQDQQRLRANLKEMPQSAAAYKRYLAKFDSQETEIEKLQEHIKSMQTSLQRLRQECEAYVNQLDLESEIQAPYPKAPPQRWGAPTSAPVSVPVIGSAANPYPTAAPSPRYYAPQP